MKKYRILVASLLIGLSSLSGIAQKPVKLGHISSQELLSAMPQSDSAQVKLERLAKEHEAVLDEMTVEFNKKYEAYKVALEGGKLSDLARATKEGELEDMQNRIQTFQQTAEQDLQKKRVELFSPVQEAALNAVNKVAAEHGFTYIFDSGMGTIVYTAPDSEDILPLVKAELGLK